MSRQYVKNFKRINEFQWGDEQVADLKKLLGDKMSASEIARDLSAAHGMPLTRNAVIGKVHRLGLTGRRAHTVARSPKPRARRKAVTRLVNHGTRFDASTAFAPEPLPERIEDIPLGQRRTLLELTEETCRWPVGDPGTPDFYFCGGNVHSNYPYCAYHARIAYEPVSDRRRARRDGGASLSGRIAMMGAWQ